MLAGLAPTCLAVVLAGLALAAPTPASAQNGSSPDGSFTTAQAEAGQGVYRRACTRCHGRELEGRNSSALAGPAFVRAWGQRSKSLDDLHYLIRTQMPVNRGGTLTDEEYLQVLAYILQQNGYEAGDEPLTDDSERLAALRIEARPGLVVAEGEPREYWEGEGGPTPSTSAVTHDELLKGQDDPKNWLYFNGDYRGRRFAGLDQINRTNVGDLRVACAFQMGEQSTFQTGPIVHEGTMYLTLLHVTTAIDARTCRPRWTHEWNVEDQDIWPNNRGVAIKDGRVVRATSDGYLFALDAANGELLWARHAASADRGETFTMAPMIYDDLVLIGPAGSENAIRGWVGAFSLETGEPVWRFNIVPRPGEPGYETWDDPPGIPVGGGAVWTSFTLDVENELLFVPATNPAPDFPAELRGGTNLYTNALIALNVRTGELAWYDQMVPFDDHDWDLTQAGPLLTTTVDGQERNIISTAGKDGILRALDLDTHERLYEVEVTTITNADAPVTLEGTHACPGVLGGVEWNGTAYNPETDLLYTPAVDWCGTYALADEVRFIPGQNYLGGTFQFDDAMQGWITAVDAADGTIAWKYRSERPVVGAVTTTAGGLVLGGELNGDFIALDAESGDELYRFNTGGPIGGGIVSYEVDGTQYIAVMSGNPSPYWYSEYSGSPTAFVFALP